MRAGRGSQAQLLRQGARGAPVVGAGLAVFAAVLIGAAAAAGIAAGDAVHGQASERLRWVEGLLGQASSSQKTAGCWFDRRRLRGAAIPELQSQTAQEEGGQIYRPHILWVPDRHGLLTWAMPDCSRGPWCGRV